MTIYDNIKFIIFKRHVTIIRHGAYDVNELYRILKSGGVFITQQVGEENERELIEFLLPESRKQFTGMNLQSQKALFQKAGFKIRMEKEEMKPIEFYDVGALVWFARIIQWEFVDFSVEQCFERLLEAQRIVERDGCIKGNVHRYLIVAQK